MSNQDNLKDRLEKIAAGNKSIEEKPVPDEVATLLEDIDIPEDKEPEKPNYRELIKNDMDNMSDDEFKRSRVEAFNSVKDDMKSRITEQSIESTEPVRQKTKAELFEEKHQIIQRVEKEVVKDNIEDDPNAGLLLGMQEVEIEAEKKSKILHELQREYVEGKTNAADEEDASSDDILNIIEKMEETDAKKELGLDEEEDTEDLTKMLEKLESEKVYSTYESSDEYTGPADYIVEENQEYQDIVENVLDENNIKVVKVSQNEKNAILDKFSNSGNIVTVPLVNSGIYISVSGASANELISMHNVTGASNAEIMLNKLRIANSHIVGSSIGKMRLSQLIQVVSYYDIDTIYYALYGGTNPENAEINRSCGSCGADYYIKMNTRDLLLNAEDFVKEASDIRDNVTTYKILLENSVLNKVVKKSFVNGNVIAYMKHPSIDSYLRTNNNLSQETLRNYSSTLIDICYSIDKLLVRKSGNQYVEFKDPNKIIEIIHKIKNTNVVYELLDAIEEIRPNALPAFGYKKTVCPHCGNTDAQEAFSISELLFTSAQQENEMATLRWAAKLQKKRQQKKK